MIAKNIDKITENDLQNLIDNSVLEGKITCGVKLRNKFIVAYFHPL